MSNSVVIKRIIESLKGGKYFSETCDYFFKQFKGGGEGRGELGL